MLDTLAFLRRVYERFNARDIDGVLACLHADVVWANGQDGGYVQGHDGVRHYWTRQWAMIDPHVEPMDFSHPTVRSSSQSVRLCAILPAGFWPTRRSVTSSAWKTA